MTEVMPITQEFSQSFKLKDKVVKFRKWKNKDRRKFIEALNDKNINEKIATDALVYNVLEDSNIILTPEEFRYSLTKIRQASVGETLDFKLNCSKCNKNFNINLNLNKIVKPIYKEYSNIKVGDISIGVGDIKNKKYYEKAILDCDNETDLFITDFLYHISSLNGSDTFSMAVLTEYFDNLDTDISDKIYDEWSNQKFKIDDVCDVECTHCGFTEKYVFDELDGFFPKTWFTRG